MKKDKNAALTRIARKQQVGSKVDFSLWSRFLNNDTLTYIASFFIAVFLTAAIFYFWP